MLDFALLSPLPTAMAMIGMIWLLVDARATRQRQAAPVLVPIRATRQRP